MGKAVFYSCKPYLQLNSREYGLYVTFGADCSYSPTDEAELQRLREYAKATESSYLISESMDPAELRRKYEELEDKMVQEAEARRKAEIEAKKKRQEEHELYSLLRM